MRQDPRPIRSARRLGCAGFTLIELMVAILIGFAVVGALLAAYMASYRSTMHNDALSEITEDATLALNAIRAQSAMAGYSAVTVNGTTKTMQTNNVPAVYGCALSNFAGPPFVGINSSAPCTGTSTSDTLEVAYQANDSTFAGGSSNAILNAAGLPLDCLGNPFPMDPTGSYYLADSKFYVSNGMLYCQGPGNVSAGAPLVDNIDHMTVRFGVSTGQSLYDGTSFQIAKYLPAPAVPAGTGDWTNVVAVTVCIVVHSTSIAIEPNGGATNPLANYVDCNSNPQQSGDGLLRRAFSTTIVFQNKVI